MAISTIILKVLPALLCLVDGQKIVCNVKDCYKSFENVDDAKETVDALKAQMEKLVSEVKDLQADKEKLQAAQETSNTGVNLKQCSRRGLNDDRKNGTLWSCDFVKKGNDTVLRVVWNGLLRLIHDGNKRGSCRRWYFTLNGKECSQPMTIETQIFTNSIGKNRHRPAHVEGYCRGIAAGSVLVEWNIGDCISTIYDTGASYTGWETTVRIIIEEVNVNDASTMVG